MRKIILPLLILTLIFSVWSLVRSSSAGNSGAPPYAIEDLDPPDNDSLPWLSAWTRPEGPAKVALQAGHWNNSELPDELERLRGRTGSSGGGRSEWEVNLAIASKTAEILRNRGVIVDILPSTIPPQYWADVFVAIHADGSTDTGKSGFKAATPRRDYTGSADELLDIIESEYQTATSFEKDPNVTRNMRGYYAFAWWRYEHAVHPMTASVILETGFLSNAEDRKIIVARPEISAQGLANGIIKYLQFQDLL